MSESEWQDHDCLIAPELLRMFHCDSITKKWLSCQLPNLSRSFHSKTFPGDDVI